MEKNTIEYLIKDYSLSESNPNIIICTGNEVFEIMNDAKRNEKQIAIFEIGDCIIDWS
jgi:hypothetical protein